MLKLPNVLHKKEELLPISLKIALVLKEIQPCWYVNYVIPGDFHIRRSVLHKSLSHNIILISCYQTTYMMIIGFVAVLFKCDFHFHAK